MERRRRGTLDTNSAAPSALNLAISVTPASRPGLFAFGPTGLIQPVCAVTYDAPYRARATFSGRRKDERPGTENTEGTEELLWICLVRSERYGGAGGDRTRDLLTASQALSQLSYSPTAHNSTWAHYMSQESLAIQRVAYRLERCRRIPKTNHQGTKTEKNQRHSDDCMQCLNR